MTQSVVAEVNGSYASKHRRDERARLERSEAAKAEVKACGGGGAAGASGEYPVACLAASA